MSIYFSDARGAKGGLPRIHMQTDHLDRFFERVRANESDTVSVTISEDLADIRR